ncbi:MAG: VOC family protein [Rhodocyclaceae bacterium]|nr:VOC family protein [Rhodocyclaceae bacterium]
MSTRLDHLIVTAPTLAEGVAAVEVSLGVSMSAGGQHVLMGTHNAVLRLGEDEYLEVIAVDPEGAAPERPRWFGLSQRVTKPGLAHWALSGQDIDAWAANLGLAAEEVIPMQRGDFEWRISVPADGHLPEGGVQPSLIQWDAGGHPTERLPDAGCRLLALVLQHPMPALIQACLESVDVDDGRLSIQHNEKPGLSALIGTPGGERWLLAET